MPELPEVETITRDLKNYIVDYTFSEIWTDSPKQIYPSLRVLKTKLTGQKITGVFRAGKWVVIEIANLKYLAIHLRMSGRLLLRKASDIEDKYCHLLFGLFKDKTKKELRFCDIRKFGKVCYFSDPEELKKKIYTGLGPEPFSKKCNLEYFGLILKNKANIKTVLLDQKLISGLGNIYVNEALFLAGISPIRAAEGLQNQEIFCLRNSIVQVLKKGIKYRGASSKDRGYVDLFGKSGNYQSHFLVYEKEKKPCPKGCGGMVKYQKIGGRGSFWCERCQR